MIEEFRAERDTIAGLGLLAANYVRFDPPLVRTGNPGHARGFNVQCLIVDNADGEVLAIEQNRIHAEENPLQHAEQVGIRVALNQLRQKYPRPTDMSVESYYKQRLFMAAGSDPADFLNKGCTLYNTFDPCGMCAVTLLVCYMKRIAYLFEDAKFSGVYETMRTYFKNRESVKEALSLVPTNSSEDSPLQGGAQLIADLRKTVHDLEQAGTPLVQALDAQLPALQKATELLMAIRPEHLRTIESHRDRNLKLLDGIKRLCNLQ